MMMNNEKEFGDRQPKEENDNKITTGRNGRKIYKKEPRRLHPIQVMAGADDATDREERSRGWPASRGPSVSAYRYRTAAGEDVQKTEEDQENTHVHAHHITDTSTHASTLTAVALCMLPCIIMPARLHRRKRLTARMGFVSRRTEGGRGVRANSQHIFLDRGQTHCRRRTDRKVVPRNE
eukprot:GHVU01118399.1.p1 GENE.GHVU01118399.1~~GHVU01118399.1.p1  ORF type:complete len:179 (-),score=26.91 GHVU01118399.1:1023-1559(-)